MTRFSSLPLYRTLALTVAVGAMLTCFDAPARAADPQAPAATSPTAPAPNAFEGMRTSFAAAIKDIQGWFSDGAKTPDDASIPPESAVEPAAGASSDEIIQVPPPVAEDTAVSTVWTPLDSNPPVDKGFGETAADQGFGATPSMAAFEDTLPTAEDLAGIATASGPDAQPDMQQVDCAAVLKAASDPALTEKPETAIVKACEIQAKDAAATPEDSAPTPALGMQGTEPASGADAGIVEETPPAE